MIAELMQEMEKKLGASIDHLHGELGKLRTGQASVVLLDGLMVDYYGNPTPLKQVATLGTPDSQTLTITPWETSILKEIEKSIQSSDLGLTPNNDGKMVRLTIPPLTSERRQQLVKLVKKYSEDCKVAIRNVRRDINEKLKKLEKNHEISEDESRKSADDTQKLTDKFVAEVDKIAAVKEKDVMDV
ncbi:MAG: ribosome recycling factor [Nitrospinaceae bacterium]|jgi:ribosome recycling factor|nr:ribosome recycling factor [Nitrospinaceae bacterium]MBT5868264.1 ribosome recycling factor [Nitrospinaceae bacterium]MBT6346393.1 ribosome recycling factor [Nitrospina sp.]